MNTPLVSVCCITYNHQDYIEECINGFLKQKLSYNVEFLIHDDASTDKTQSIIKSLVGDDSRFKLILRKQNIKSTGQPIFPILYEKAQGKYIAMCEGDDYWTDPLKLQKQVDFLEANEEYSLCFTRFKTKDEKSSTFKVDENSKYFKELHSYVDYDFEVFYKGWHIGTQTVMFKNIINAKSLFNQYKFPRDMHLYVELLKLGKGVCLKDFCAVYRITGDGVYTSTTKIQKIVNSAKVYEDIYINNKSIFYVEKKYRKFLKNYMNLLIANNDIFGYLKQMLRSYLITRKSRFLKKDVKVLVNKLK